MAPMAQNGPEAIALFGGQGSLSLFSEKTSAVASSDAVSSAAARLLLSSCHAAFLEEAVAASSDPTESVGVDVTHFSRPDHLLKPDSNLQNNPVVQGTTLCLFQLLRYLSHVAASSSSFEYAADHLSEAAGFCSGVLPAAVVASCRTELEFVAAGVQAFRLAFWIGYRCAAYAEKTLGKQWNEIPWSLVVLGMRKEQLVQSLNDFHSTVSTMLWLGVHSLRKEQSSQSRIHIAAISSGTCFTLAGSGPTLDAFRTSHISDPYTARFAHVHTLYHAGEELRQVLSEVTKDILHRDIRMPTLASLRRPLRSTVDGELVHAEGVEADSLIQHLLEMILVRPVDWEQLWAKLLSRVSATLQAGSSEAVQVLSFGPTSSSILFGARSQDDIPGLSLVDVSQVPNAIQHALPESDDSIAIVGMGVNFPKGGDPDALWRTLETGLNTVEEVGRRLTSMVGLPLTTSQIPGSRFDVSRYYDPDKSSKTSDRKMTTKYGNFVDDVWSFDNNFFRISPREAKSMDPQQRMVLQTAYTAMEHAGYVEDSTESFQRSTFGAYVGVATGDYVDSLRDDIDVYYSPGTLRAFLSGRISYAFKLSGPSVVIDTACSSSVVAIHQACRALKNGDCKAALAGGVNVLCGPDMYLGLSRAHFLSTTGQCKAFDEAADGYCRAEGCGMFVLKRLADARAENDQILGVIRGVELNQSGNAHSITHPHAETQQDLFMRLLQKHKIDPHSINVVEAHGTGTQAGDPVELKGLRKIFAQSRSLNNPLYVTSIKSNIGHCEAASGSAGLAKLLLMLKKKQIPIQTAFENLNPAIEPLDSDNVIIPRSTVTWDTASNEPRRALLNNFGAAGSNGALILEEYLPRQSFDARGSFLFTLSAQTVAALQELRERYSILIKSKQQTISLRNLSYTTTARRRVLEHRMAFSYSSTHDLVQKLANPSLQHSQPKRKPDAVVFVFSGQGSQYVGMGRELLETAPVFRSTVLACDDMLVQLGYTSVLPILKAREEDNLTFTDAERIEAFQYAIFVIEYALAMLWISWNVKPDVVIGHSLGEYAALVVAGVLTLPDALHLVAYRARLMAKLCKTESSGMIAVNLNAVRVEEILESDSATFGQLSVACRNSNTDCVVAGPLVQVDALEKFLKTNLYKATKLRVPFGYHSACMNPIQEPLTRFASSIKLAAPVIPIGSNALGRMLTTADLVPDYFATHARSPVLFYNELQAIDQHSMTEASLFLEIGPHPTTLPMVRSTLASSENTYLASMHKTKNAWLGLCDALGEMFLRGISVDWRRVYDGCDVHVMDLPSYPFTKNEFRVAHKEPAAALDDVAAAEADSAMRFSLLSSQQPATTVDGFPIYETKLSSLATYIVGHAVGGIALCPASVYYEMVLEAAQISIGPDKDHVFAVEDINFPSPLLYDPQSPERIVRVTMERSLDTTNIDFAILSYETDAKDGTVHCTGSIETRSTRAMREKFARKTALVQRQEHQLLSADKRDFDTFRTRILYETIFSRVVKYSKGYQSISSISISAAGSEGYGTFQLPDLLKAPTCIVQPVFADTLLHAAGFLANSSVDASEVCICGQVESVKMLYDDINFDDTFRVFCSTMSCIEGTILADAYAVDPSGRVMAAIKGMHFKRLRLQSFKVHLEGLVRKMKGITNPPPRLNTAVTTAQMTPASSSAFPTTSMMDTQDSAGIIARAIAEACGIPMSAIEADKDLEELGVDSLMLIEIAESLKLRFSNQSLDSQALLACRTQRDFERSIGSNMGTQSTQTAKVTQSLASDDDDDDSSTITSDSSPASAFRRVDFEMTRVRQLLGAVSGVSETQIESTSMLESLGLDSLMSIEFLESFRKEHGFEISTEDFRECRTVEDLERLEAHMDQKLQPPAPVNDMKSITLGLHKQTLPLSLQQSTSRATPLYLVHDGSGLCNMYSRLHSLNRAVHGFFNPGLLEAREAAPTLVDMATRYAALMDASGVKSVILGGWSFGGVVAFEMANQLHRMGKQVKGVVMIDSPCPINHKPLPASVIAHITRSNVKSGAAREMERLIAAQFQNNTSMLVQYNPSPARCPIKLMMLRSREGFHSEKISGIPNPWLDDRSRRSDAVNEWETLTGRKIPVMDIPGTHFEAFAKQNMAEVSSRLDEACRLLDSSA
ncbi:MAG: Type I Iterative PKS [Caeruleum heppii]|nr:MAG: Type I Iterative PKS [Caeruleum heppii]